MIGAFPKVWRVEARGNVAAGLLATIVTLPLSMGLGALAFAPFGPEYAARGVLAGLYAAAFLGLGAIVMGARGPAIYAPRSLVSFMVASVAADLFVGAKWLPRDPDLVMAAIFLTLAMAGAFQLAFGLARLAKVVKFIPTPVMAGFQNAASTIIMLSQVPILLGLTWRPALREWPAAIAETRSLSVVVALATLVIVFKGGRFVKRVPPLVLGLVGGSAVYYLLLALGGGAYLGSTLGHIPLTLPDGHDFANIIEVLQLPGFAVAFPAMVLGAASIALVASLDVIISAKIVENLSGRRGNATQELISIGGGNLIAPLLGGVAGSISLASTTTAVKGGARTSLALLVHALLFLAFVPLLAAAIGHLPRVVIAALVFYSGMQLFDRWTLGLLRRIAERKAVHWRGIALDLFVIGIVASVALAGEIVAAVLIGVTVAVVVFTLRMSRGIIRREQYGDVAQSRRAREAGDSALLAQGGRAILAIELEGPLFFGSAEALHNRLDAAIAEGVRYVALDVSRVTELDSTGARIMLQAEERLRSANCRLVLCGAALRPELAAMLADHGVAEALTPARIFPDLDRALESCEDELLATHRSAGEDAAELPLGKFDLFGDVHAGDFEALREVLVRREYPPGSPVFKRADEGDALYLIARGSASAWLDDTRLMTFSKGTFFGEMALLDRERRSATVTADTTLVCYVLERASFERLAASHPHASIVLLANVARELSRRMRRTNRSLLELA
ncbi:MAG TPA: SulP family inorganic anion transporter [Usitatibacter sp.]|nr:SulP family inorganic anion transporter [Usitatibacter sp.]